MRLAVATHSFLCVFELTEDWQIRECQVVAEGHHYGIAPDPETHSFLAVENARGRVERDRLTWRKYANDGEYSTEASGALPAHIEDAHQIAMRGRGFYVANTAKNSVEYVHLNGSPTESFHFGDHQIDINHVNSVFPAGAGQLFVVLHNTNTSAGISEIAVMEHAPGDGFDMIRRVRLWHHGCHNVYVDPPNIVYNASPDGEVCVYDFRRNAFRAKLALPGHTKGLAATESHFILGFSEHASREERFTSEGRLAVVERDSLDIECTIDLNVDALPHPIGNVNEVRLLGRHDLAHRRASRAVDAVDDFGLANDDPKERLRYGWCAGSHWYSRPVLALIELLKRP